MAEQPKICPCCGRDQTGRADYFVQFVHDFCLELRTPLNSLIGFADVMLGGQDGALSNLQRQDAETIYHTGQQALGLINDLVDMSKLVSGGMSLELEDVDLTVLIDEIIPTLHKYFADKTIQFQPAPDLPLIRADRFRLKQILHGLVMSFLRYIGETLVIRCQRVEKEAVPLAQISLQGDWLLSEWRADFEQLLGQTDLLALLPGHPDLFIARSLIAAHGGAMWTETSEQSATLYLTLPALATTARA